MMGEMGSPVPSPTHDVAGKHFDVLGQNNDLHSDDRLINLTHHRVHAIGDIPSDSGSDEEGDVHEDGGAQVVREASFHHGKMERLSLAKMRHPMGEGEVRRGHYLA